MNQGDSSGLSSATPMRRIIYKRSSGKVYGRAIPISNGASAIESDIERLWLRIDRRGPSECWEWRGASNKAGYGRVRIAGHLRLPHRVVFEATHGLIPSSDRRLVVMHTCDNPKCCNPDHLRLGTDTDNRRDRMAKGR